MLLVIATLLPHPFQNIVMQLTMEKQQLQQHITLKLCLKIASEYDQEIPQSQTADNPVALRGRAAQPSRAPGRQIKQSNQLSLPHQAYSLSQTIILSICYLETATSAFWAQPS